MWKLFKFLGRLIKAILWLGLILFIVTVVGLYFAEKGLPDWLVQKVAERLTSDPHLQKAMEETTTGPLVFRIDRITYSAQRGLTIHQIKALPTRTPERPFLSAEEIRVDFALFSLAPFRDRLRNVTLKGFDFPELPPRPPRDPDAPRPPPVAREINVILPDIAPFELILDNANILGLQPEKITATVASTTTHASVTNLKAKWPDRAGDVTVTGDLTFDPETKRVVGNAQGRAFPHLITPLLLGLRAKGTVMQIDCFQAFTTPVTVGFSVDLELTKMDYAMAIDIDVKDCTYRGIPVRHAEGVVTVTDTNNSTIVTIDPVSWELKTGALAGRLVYRDDDDSVFIDAHGIVPKPDLIAIINVLNNGELDLIQCESPIVATVKGIVATNLKKEGVTNDLNAALSFAKGSILNIPLADVSCDLKMEGFTAQVDNIKASPVDGGNVRGWVHFAFPNYSASNTTFVTQVSASDADFSNLMCLSQTNNTVTGKATGNISLSGSASENMLGSLNGEGTMKVDDSVFVRIPLFAGLTDWFANNIPGISSVVNQSSIKLDCRITNGVAVTENMWVEGNVFSVRCKGSYALDTNVVNGVARVNILREQTLVGRILHLITTPITSVLLDFRISGIASEPEWAYITFVEKLVDTIF
ncbi:MAG: AsmA-like C-terminal region-containing protein [Kiritimatiellaeota bacterium]|nr:AsmA-like C-terminal region-containing protein [Kiritimatiellota bacterium]